MAYRRASYAMFSASLPWTSSTNNGMINSNAGRFAERDSTDRKNAEPIVTARVIVRTSGCSGVLQFFNDDDCDVVVSTLSHV